MSTRAEVVEDKSEFDLEKVNALPLFDAADYLDSPEMLAAYLNEVFSEGSVQSIVEGLRTVSRAKGMAEVASVAGIARESLYKALRPANNQPRLETVMGVLKALGLRLVVEPLQESNRSNDLEDDGDDEDGSE
jgi:probable addiction module antidote protein